MLYWLHQLLKNPDPNAIDKSFVESVANVFGYVTFRAVAGGVLALCLTLLIGPKIIRKLLSLKMGQPIRTAEEVRQLYALHRDKSGTPTMGGIMIIIAFVLAVLFSARLDNQLVWIVLLVTVALAFLGFGDDFAKVTKNNSKGVSSRTKLVVQFGVAALAGSLIYFQKPEYYGQLWMPFWKKELVDLGPWIVLLFVIVIVGASNAVNLTDGLDGLAIGCTIPVAVAYAVFCYVTGHKHVAAHLLLPHSVKAAEITIVCAALMGASLGFLWFNCAPARVFMGDTGSLAIGGAIGAIAICCKQELTLLIVGAVFVAEAVSVMLQVSYFKYTRKKHGQGRRLLKMSPLHHHFELSGLPETQVVVRFWIMSLFCAVLGLATLKLR